MFCQERVKITGRKEHVKGRRNGGLRQKPGRQDHRKERGMQVPSTCYFQGVLQALKHLAPDG